LLASVGFQSWVVHEKGVCKLEDEGIKVGGQGWEGFPQSCFEEENVESKETVAVDINTAEVVGKDDEHYARIPTRLGEVQHWKSLAESSQRKYSKRWRGNRRILRRIRSFHLKAKIMMEDFARKVGKWVVEEAERFGANVVKLESLKDLIKDVDKLTKEFRDKLYLMQHRRLQSGSFGRLGSVMVEFVNPIFFCFMPKMR